MTPSFPFTRTASTTMSDSSASNFGPVKPYGVAIREATASGDTARMRKAGEQARQWLADNPGDDAQGEVHAALRELDAALGTS